MRVLSQRQSKRTFLDELQDVLGLLAPSQRLGDGRQISQLFSPLEAGLALSLLVGLVVR